MAQTLDLLLPFIDLSSPDRISTAQAIRQACLDHGFFYLVNHGVEDEMTERVLEESRAFFALPIEEKMKLERTLHTGYTGYSPLFAEKLDTSIQSKGDSKESFDVGNESTPQKFPNLWPSKDLLPCWRTLMESYHGKLMIVSEKLLSLIALALNLDEDFFEKVGAYPPYGYVRLLHYTVSGEHNVSDAPTYGSSAHSDYGMITLLTTDGVPGLQICRGKDKSPKVWEDVPHVNGAFIVNIGDMLERWTNCLFRSTLHRVIGVGQERYSAAFFCNPNVDCMVECLESCCSETSPPRFRPIPVGDYLDEHFNVGPVYVINSSCEFNRGSGIQTKKQFLFGSVEMLIKLVPGNSPGTVTAYYLSSTGTMHDEIDFEFLGNVSGQSYIVHTNVYTRGNGSKEQQFYLWFNPSADFHNYTIHWNPKQIVWFIDGLPIRVFQNNENIGLPFPNKQPMRAYSSLWNADDWATRGGLVKIDWNRAPFATHLRHFRPRACKWAGPISISQCAANSADNWWNSSAYIKLSYAQMGQMKWVRDNYMIYDYCKDTKRFKGQMPLE